MSIDRLITLQFLLSRPCSIFQFRVANLELLSQYGVNAWRQHCDLLQQMLEAQQKKHADLKYVSVCYSSMAIGKLNFMRLLKLR